MDGTTAFFAVLGWGFYHDAGPVSADGAPSCNVITAAMCNSLGRVGKVLDDPDAHAVSHP